MGEGASQNGLVKKLLGNPLGFTLALDNPLCPLVILLLPHIVGVLAELCHLCVDLLRLTTELNRITQLLSECHCVWWNTSNVVAATSFCY